jgi:hypothetical protein
MHNWVNGFNDFFFSYFLFLIVNTSLLVFLSHLVQETAILQYQIRIPTGVVLKMCYYYYSFR